MQPPIALPHKVPGERANPWGGDEDTCHWDVRDTRLISRHVVSLLFLPLRVVLLRSVDIAPQRLPFAVDGGVRMFPSRE